MKAKTFAEHRIHSYLEAVYPGLNAQVEFVGQREAIVTDGNGDRIRVRYSSEGVYEMDV